ncbi:hypothetical protein NEOLI_004812 [Neolecta irregularis DAH-3]|uniref:Uncharacterized protein n=1 Tax=Neolecta irregularis (strain DAH-3) TaxID=1198029 RepID=A0A1U7LPJ6_NEOID|nr:hypothetical protein NEOLI_004812 [Neolecta irregularis DAH-3]|eukprot:OLL24574.1 hypothetical protein NEOLI_004812 [Neolecta irregularis DAH-3]
MSANEEQLQLLDSMHIDAVTDVLLVYSVAFLSYLCGCFILMWLTGDVLFLIHVYECPKEMPANDSLEGNELEMQVDAEAFELGNLLEEGETDEEDLKKHQELAFE